MIHFSTPGTLDLRCLTHFGVNVKPNTDSPIGYFGTGLKYAIAVLLREGAKIKLQTNGITWVFYTRNDTIRGKEFPLCYMREIENPETPMGPDVFSLPFTLELGKNWTLENAYRELYSNTKDEHGRFHQADNAEPDNYFQTIISVDLPAFDTVHELRDSIIFEPQVAPLFANDHGEIFPYSSEAVFYRGIAVHKLRKPSAFTYNILKNLTLSEDRQASSWDVNYEIARLISVCNDPQIIRSALIDESKAEHDLEFAYADKSDLFLETVGKLLRTNSVQLAPSAAKAFYQSAKAIPTFEECGQTISQSTALARTLRMIASCGIPVYAYQVKLSHSLGKSILACAHNNAIWLTPQVFSEEKLLLSAILEEFVHLRYAVQDCTRPMQNAIFGLLAEVITEKGES